MVTKSDQSFRAYQQIKEGILTNRLRPGTKLNHQLLAERLGISRTPVRESLERLHQEGLVTRIANRGHIVTEIDAQELRDLYETREALETHVVRLLFSKGLVPEAIARLDALNERYQHLCSDKLTRERLLLDRDFHMALAESSGNAYLVKTLGAVFERLVLKRRIEGFQDHRGTEPYQEHVRLLDALRGGDQAGAQQILRDHVSNACTRFTNYLEVDTLPGSTNAFASPPRKAAPGRQAAPRKATGPRSPPH